MRSASLHLYLCATAGSVWAVTAVPAWAQDRASKSADKPQALTATVNCPNAAGEDIVVCGRRDDRRYRIDPHVLATDRLLEQQQQRAASVDPTAESDSCNVGPHPCPGRDVIPVTAIAVVVAKAVLDAAQGDDWRKEFKTAPDAYEVYRDTADKSEK